MKKFAIPQTPEEEAFSDAKEYLKNVKEILKAVPIEQNRYRDPKRAKEACGIGYLSAKESVDRGAILC
jgi:hypothetical protein